MSTAVRGLVALYRQIPWLYPSAFREAFAGEMVAVFQAALQEAVATFLGRPLAQRPVLFRGIWALAFTPACGAGLVHGRFIAWAAMVSRSGEHSAT